MHDTKIEKSRKTLEFNIYSIFKLTFIDVMNYLLKKWLAMRLRMHYNAAKS